MDLPVHACLMSSHDINRHLSSPQGAGPRIYFAQRLLPRRHRHVDHQPHPHPRRVVRIHQKQAGIQEQLEGEQF